MKELNAFKKKVRIEIEELTHKIKLLEVQLNKLHGTPKRLMKEAIHRVRALKEAFLCDYNRVVHKPTITARALEKLDNALQKLRQVCRTSLQQVPI